MPMTTQSKILIVFVSILVVAGVYTIINAQDNDDKVIPFQDLPEEVQAAIRNKMGAADDYHIELDSDNDADQFEVECIIDDMEKEMVVSSTGHIVEFVGEIPFSDLPPLLQTAVNEKYPGHTVDRIQQREYHNYKLTIQHNEQEVELKAYSTGGLRED